MRYWTLAAVAVILMGTITSCSMDSDDKGFGDAPVATASTGKKGGENSPATITNMPNNYGNLATKCVAGAQPWRVIEGTNTDYTGSLFGLVQDPKKCGGDWLPGPKVVMSNRATGAEEPDDS